MITRNRLHAEVLRVVNETCLQMPMQDRSRLAVSIARGLFPVMVEQIQRGIDEAAEDADPIGRGHPVGGGS